MNGKLLVKMILEIIMIELNVIIIIINVKEMDRHERGEIVVIIREMIRWIIKEI